MTRRTQCTIALGGALSILLFALWRVDFFIVATASMQPTLAPGDVVICTSGTSNIRAGDIVVFNFFDGRGIKRVIGVPGDHVTYFDKTLVINGSIVAKHLLQHLPSDNSSDLLFAQSLSGETFRIYESFGSSLTEIASSIIDGYMLMGDNRDSSTDSRDFGSVDRDDIVCEAHAILATEIAGRFSFDRTGFID